MVSPPIGDGENKTSRVGIDGDIREDHAGRRVVFRFGFRCLERVERQDVVVSAAALVRTGAEITGASKIGITLDDTLWHALAALRVAAFRHTRGRRALVSAASLSSSS